MGVDTIHEGMEVMAIRAAAVFSFAPSRVTHFLGVSLKSIVCDNLLNHYLHG